MAEEFDNHITPFRHVQKKRTHTMANTNQTQTNALLGLIFPGVLGRWDVLDSTLEQFCGLRAEGPKDTAGERDGEENEDCSLLRHSESTLRFGTLQPPSLVWHLTLAWV